jgi:hypothetical protein
MLNTKLAPFIDLVWAKVAAIGYDAPKIADSVLGVAFPKTERAATEEGALSMLRDGVTSYIRKLIKKIDDERQGDFGDIEPRFREIVKRAGLKNAVYFVEALGRHVTINDLIKEPPLLDDARQFMRRKGEECIAEADRLDELYLAVTAADESLRP